MFKAYSWADLRKVVDYLYQGQRMRIVPYHYPFTIPVIANNARSESTLNLLSNADFLALGIITNSSVPGAKMNIVDSASNERWFDANCPVPCIASGPTPQLRAFLWPRWVAANSTLLLQFEGLADAVGTAVPAALTGVLAYPY